jgi:stage IV sporulation protein FB
MRLKINPLTVLLLAAAAYTGNLLNYILAYAVMAAHECAHLIAALCIGLKPDSITLAPFGVQLRLKNKIVRSLADEIILYSAGPLLNAVLAVIMLITGHITLYRMNTALMIMNLLPIIPLDGGVILKRIISNKFGKHTSQIVLKCVSVCFCMVFFILTAASIYRGTINFTMLIMLFFLFGNFITSQELYDVDFINALSSKKRTNKARLVIIDDKNTVLNAAKQISTENTIIGAVIDKNGKVSNLLSEEEIIEQAARN